MLQTLDEFKKVEMTIGPIVNGVDNPGLMSVDSTESIQTGVDAVGREEEKKEVVIAPPVKSEDTTEEVKPDPQPEKKEEVKSEKDPVAKRIGELTKRWRTVERERDYLSTKLQEKEEELQKLKSTIPAKDKPVKANFESDEEFYEALTDWKVDEKLRIQQEKVIDSTKNQEERQAIAETFSDIDSVIEKGRTKYADFDELAMTVDLPISQDMTELIMKSKIGEDVFYFLGQNPDVAAEIFGMSPKDTAREMGIIEGRLLALPKKEEKKEEGEENKPPPKEVKLTNTPPPIEPVRTTGVIDRDPSQMTPKEYRAWREGKR